jgi:hypothetical protein
MALSKYIEEVCKIGQMHACCRYLGASSHGMCCLKQTEHKALLDRRAALRLMHAQGDNCPGQDPDLDLNTLPDPPQPNKP